MIRSHIRSLKEVISKHSTEIVLLKHVKMFSFVGRLKMLLITSEDVSFSNALFQRGGVRSYVDTYTEPVV